MRYSGLATVLIGLSALCWTACGSSRQASEVSSSWTSQATESSARVQVSGFEEARDSLREEISQNLNENLAEHEVVTWTVIHRQAQEPQPGDTVKVERVTDRTKFQVSSSTLQDSRVAVRTEVVRDTVYIEHRDTVVVQDSRFMVHESTDTKGSRSSIVQGLKWIFWIIIGLIGLIVTVKVCLRM